MGFFFCLFVITDRNIHTKAGGTSLAKNLLLNALRKIKDNKETKHVQNLGKERKKEKQLNV